MCVCARARVCVCVCAHQLTESKRVLTLWLLFVQASLPVHNQVLPSIEGVDGSDPLATLQNPMGRLEAKEEEDEDEDEDTEEDEEEDGEDTDLDDWEPDPPRPFDPHDLCKCELFLGWGCEHGNMVSIGWGLPVCRSSAPCSACTTLLGPHNSLGGRHRCFWEGSDLTDE